jgi:parvulin-like peptidyl-prolyl isomerase
MSEDKNVPLFELMNNNDLIDNVFSTAIGQIGGPVKTQDGEIIFKVLGEKAFDQGEYEKSKDYITNIYNNLKENNLFNDWYMHSLRNAKIVDNFDQFFKS